MLRSSSRCAGPSVSVISNMRCTLDWSLNLQEVHWNCLRVLGYHDYCLLASSDFALAVSLSISFVSSHFLFPFGCFGFLVAYFSCHFFKFHYVFLLLFCSGSLDAIKGLLLWTSCAVSRILVLQLCDLLLPTLLNDGVFFALILEEFLGNVLHDGVEEREIQRCSRSCRQKQNIEDYEFIELNALVGSDARFRWVRTTVSFLLSFG